MGTVLDSIQDVRNLNDGNNITSSSSIADSIKDINSLQIQNPVQNQAYTNENNISTLTGAVGLGLGNMTNDTFFGGSGWVFGNLGRGVEYISPYSGKDNTAIEELRRLGYTDSEIEQAVKYRDSYLTQFAKGLLTIHNGIEDDLNKLRNNLLGDNPTLAARTAEGLGSVLGFVGLGYLASGLAATPGMAGLIGTGVHSGLESIS